MIRWKNWINVNGYFLFIQLYTLCRVVFPKHRSADHLWSVKIQQLVRRNLFVSQIFYFWLNRGVCWTKQNQTGPSCNYLVRETNFCHLWSATQKSLGNTDLRRESNVNNNLVLPLFYIPKLLASWENPKRL